MPKKEKLDILFEDKSLIIVNKPSKKLTISTDKEKYNTLYNEVYTYLHKKNQKCFIIHRLDKDTSGLIMFAKNEKVKNKMQDNWENVIRKYYAIVEGKVKNNGKIESYLKETKTLYTYSTSDKKSGKYALTIYNPIKNNNAYTLLDILIKTGRKNQIRVHLKDINHPIIGDKKYNASRNPLGKLGLHAYYLEFIHPITKQPIIIKTDIPNEYQNIFK